MGRSTSSYMSHLDRLETSLFLARIRGWSRIDILRLRHESEAEAEYHQHQQRMVDAFFYNPWVTKASNTVVVFRGFSFPPLIDPCPRKTGTLTDRDAFTASSEEM